MHKATSSKTLGQILKSARLEKGLNQKQAGGLVGITQAMVSRIETGESNARIDTLFRLLSALDMDMAITPRVTSSSSSEGDRW